MTDQQPRYALRVDGPDAAVAYSGDTEWTEALFDAARGNELFCARAAALLLRPPVIATR